jgi:hypothetical protein
MDSSRSNGLNFSAIVHLFTTFYDWARRVVGIRGLQPPHFRGKRDTASFDWTAGRGFAYKVANAPGAI